MDEKQELQKYSTRFKEDKIKSRNLSEKKRRDQFNMLINELCSMVSSNGRKMDKSSVLRTTISFLRTHSELSVQSQNVKVQENWKPSFLSNEEFTHLMLEAVDGFIIVFSSTGQILYTSESTASLLGYLPSRIYSSVFDIIHDMDKNALSNVIKSPPSSSTTSLPKDNFISLHLHMKRGPIHTHSSSSYELVKLLGTYYHWPSSYEAGSSPPGFDGDNSNSSSVSSVPQSPVDSRPCFVALGRLQTPHLLRIVNLTDDAKNEFTSRHSLEWKFLFLDHRAPPIIGYLPFEVLGTSGYDYYHMDDLDNIVSSHELLMQTGEGTSCFYRFLTKGQQWIWLQTRYYISYHQWNSKPEFIVCTHTVVSTDRVLKSIQEKPKECSKKPSVIHPVVSPSPSASMSPSPSVSSLGSLSSEQSEQCPSKASTGLRSKSVLYSNSANKEKSSGMTCRVPSNRLTSSQKDFSDLPTSFTPLHKAPSQPPNSASNEMSSGSYNHAANVNLIHQTQAQKSEQISSHVDPSQGSCVQEHNIRLPIPVMNPFPSPDPSPTAMNQSQVHEYLRQRHQALQQQIMMQQEELRQISEQLLIVQHTAPNNSSSRCDASQYQAQDMDHMQSYDQTSYSQARPMYETHSSSEGYARTSENEVIDTRTYLNLESNMCSSEMPLLSSEADDAIAQSYSVAHSMQTHLDPEH